MDKDITECTLCGKYIVGKIFITEYGTDVCTECNIRIGKADVKADALAKIIDGNEAIREIEK